jgi:hypothetical protein
MGVLARCATRARVATGALCHVDGAASFGHAGVPGLRHGPALPPAFGTLTCWSSVHAPIRCFYSRCRGRDGCRSLACAPIRQRRRRQESAGIARSRAKDRLGTARLGSARQQLCALASRSEREERVSPDSSADDHPGSGSRGCSAPADDMVSPAMDWTRSPAASICPAACSCFSRECYRGPIGTLFRYTAYRLLQKFRPPEQLDITGNNVEFDTEARSTMPNAEVRRASQSAVRFRGAADDLPPEHVPTPAARTQGQAWLALFRTSGLNAHPASSLTVQSAGSPGTDVVFVPCWPASSPISRPAAPTKRGEVPCRPALACPAWLSWRARRQASCRPLPCRRLIAASILAGRCMFPGWVGAPARPPPPFIAGTYW